MITAVPENLHWIWAACCFYTGIHRKMTDSLNIIPGLFRHHSYESSQKLFLLLCLFRKYFRFSEFGYAYPWQDSFLGRKMSTLCLAFSILSLFTKCTRYRLHNGTEIKSYHPSKGILYRGVWLCYLFSGGIALFSIILSIAYVWRTTTILVWALINVPMINLNIHVMIYKPEVHRKYMMILPGKHHKQLLVRYQ